MNPTTDKRLRALESRLHFGADVKDAQFVEIGLDDFDGWEISSAHTETVQIMREAGESDEALQERVEAYTEAHRRHGAPFFMVQI